MIAVSLNVGHGVRRFKPSKLYMCTQNTTNTMRTDARRRVYAAMVPYRRATWGTSLRELYYNNVRRFLLLSKKKKKKKNAGLENAVMALKYMPFL